MLCSIPIGGIIGIAVAALALLCVIVLAIRANVRSVKQPQEELVSVADLNEENAPKHLQEAVRFPTVSMIDEYAGKDKPFLEMRKWLLETYPNVAKQAELTIIAGYSLVFRLEGSDPSLLPACFLSHQDVVPADPTGWDHPPFSGVLAEDGYIYGRGTMDMKYHLISVLEGVEYWLKKGKRFKRTVYLCFGHDEEPTQSQEGAPNIVRYFQEKGVRFEYVLDEGGSIIEGKQLFAKGVIAAVGATEKAAGDLEIIVTKEGGHSSRPSYPSANGILANVIRKIEKHQMPSRMTPLLKSTFVSLSSATNPLLKFFLANSDVFSPLLRWILGIANPVTNALIRTTLATTVIKGSDARNTIPGVVTLNVNYRLLCGDTTQDVVDHLKKVLRKEFKRKQVTIKTLQCVDQCPESPCDNETFETLAKSIRKTFPDTTVIPYVFLGGTDSSFYTPVCDKVYRFGPMMVGIEDEHRFHGLNERITPAAVNQSVKFIITYLQDSCYPYDPS